MSGYFPPEEYEDRWRRLGEEMRRQGFRAALVWSRSAGGYEKFADVFYLTHYYSNQSGQADEDAWLGVGFAAAIVTPDEAPELIADLPAFPEDAVATDRIVRSEEPNRVQLVCDAMRARGLDEGPVALVGDHFLPWRYARVPAGRAPRRRVDPGRRAGGGRTPAQVPSRAGLHPRRRRDRDRRADEAAGARRRGWDPGRHRGRGGRTSSSGAAGTST
jgi:hypothetical protein